MQKFYRPPGGMCQTNRAMKGLFFKLNTGHLGSTKTNISKCSVYIVLKYYFILI